jgi:hypothetical protein
MISTSALEKLLFLLSLSFVGFFFIFGLNTFLVHVVRAEIKWLPWFHKISQVIPIVNLNTNLHIPSRFRPLF